MTYLKHFEEKCCLLGEAQLFLDAKMLTRKDCIIDDKQVEMLKLLREYFSYGKEGLLIANEKITSACWWEDKSSEKITRFRFFVDFLFQDIFENFHALAEDFEKCFITQVDNIIFPIDEAIITKHVTPNSFQHIQQVLQKLIDHHLCKSHSLDRGCF